MRFHPVLILLALCAVCSTGCTRAFFNPETREVGFERFLTDAHVGDLTYTRTGDDVSVTLSGYSSEGTRITEMLVGALLQRVGAPAPARPTIVTQPAIREDRDDAPGTP